MIGLYGLPTTRIIAIFSHIPADQRGQINFDHPDALETDLLVQHLQALSRGETISIPTYDFTTHIRTSETP